jgi:hypothetical protein
MDANEREWHSLIRVISDRSGPVELTLLGISSANERDS